MENNTPVILDNPNIALLVVDGKAEVFAQPFKDGRASGARTHFFSASPGDALFGVSASASGFRLLAVGGQETRAIHLDVSLLNGGCLETGTQPDASLFKELCDAADRFVLGIGSGLTRNIAPRPRKNADMVPGLALKVDKRTIGAPRRGTAWISDVNGSRPLFLGQEEAVVRPGEFFPLPENCWLCGTGAATIKISKSSDVLAAKALLPSLNAWCALALAQVEVNTRLEMVDTLNAIRGKHLADEERARQSALELASVLRPEVDRPVPATDGGRVFRTMCLVGNALGIQFACPPGSPGDTARETPWRIAEHSGIRYRVVALENGWWKRDSDSLLAFRKQGGEPVAVLRDARGRAFEAGLDGSRQLLNRARAEELEGTGYVFHAPLPFTPLTKADLAVHGFKGLGRDVRTAVLAGLATGLLSLILPMAAKSIFNSIIPASDQGRLAAVMCVVAGAMVAAALLRMAGGIATLRLEAHVEARLETALWDRLLRMPSEFFARYSAGNLAGRGETFQRIRETFSAGALVGLTAGVFSLANLLLMFVLSPLLGMAATALILVQGLVTWGLTSFRLKRLRMAARLRARLDGLVLQFVSGLHQLRSSGSENRAFGRWASDFARQRAFQYKAFQGRNILRAFNAGYTVLSMAIIFAVAGIWLDTLDTGTFVAFYVAFGALQSGILQIIVSLSQATAAAPILERVGPILKTAPEDNGSKPDPGSLNGGIDVSGATFRYAEKSAPAVDAVDLSVAPGEFVALVGPSGSGKTTLLRLLAGLEVPQTGSICFDDRNLAEMDARLVRRNMGVVLQDFGLLPGTIRQTIAGDRFPSEEDVWAAAVACQIDQDIRAMEGGLDFQIARSGTNLSGGQRQKLMIARAILPNPPILIMDEATSSLDNDTQARVIKNLEMHKSTRIVAAHRLSTIRNADRILVMERGRIVESGDYSSLMARKGLFYAMAKRQMA